MKGMTKTTTCGVGSGEGIAERHMTAPVSARRWPNAARLAILAVAVLLLAALEVLFAILCVADVGRTTAPASLETIAVADAGPLVVDEVSATEGPTRLHIFYTR